MGQLVQQLNKFSAVVEKDERYKIQQQEQAQEDDTRRAIAKTKSDAAQAAAELPKRELKTEVEPDDQRPRARAEVDDQRQSVGEKVRACMDQSQYCDSGCGLECAVACTRQSAWCLAKAYGADDETAEMRANERVRGLLAYLQSMGLLNATVVIPSNNYTAIPSVPRDSSSIGELSWR
jgi:hypothetical protein